MQYFEPDWESKKTPAIIRKVTGTKLGRLKFQLEFPELNETFVDYNLKYIIKYLVDAPPGRFAEMLNKKKRRPAKFTKATPDKTVELQSPTLKTCNALIEEEISVAVLSAMKAGFKESSNSELRKAIAFEDSGPELAFPDSITTPEESNFPLTSGTSDPIHVSLVALPASPITPMPSPLPPSPITPVPNPPVVPANTSQHTVFVPSAELSDYFTRHSWMTSWGNQKKSKSSIKNDITAPTSNPQMQHPRYCTVYKNFRQNFQIDCPALSMRKCGPETSFICKMCGVYLHQECSLLYHQLYASDRLV
jgi:hypothetical protein